MPPLSALDAIQPAWIHTRLLLLGRRDWQLLLKLTAVAVLAELGGGFALNIGSPGRGHGHGLPATIAAFLLPLIVILAVGGLLFGLAMFYIGSRLQFVLFHIVLRGETRVTPLWRRYGPATWRWIGLKLLLAVVALACMLPFALPPFLLLVRAAPRGSAPFPTSGPLLAALLGLAAVVLLAVFLVAALFVLLRDFGLPSMALEATSLRETFRRITALVRQEPAQMALFVLMRFVLALTAALAAYVALLVLILLAAVPFGSVGFGLWAALHRGSAAGHGVMFGSFAVLCMLLVALLVLAGIMLFGYGYTFLQAYAIFFIAARYPLLATQLQILAPVPEPVSAWPPTVGPSWNTPPV